MGMIDRENVIRSVDVCFDYWLEQHRCIYPLELEDVRQLKADALALLKEQEAVEPLRQNSNGWIRTIQLWYCGACHAKISKRTSKFCSNCGKPVKWK